MTVGERGIQLRTFQDVWNLASCVAKSGLAPKGMQTREQIVIAIQYGAELGYGPMQSIQTIAVINNRPCIWGDGLLGRVLSSPVCEDVVEEIEGTGENMVAICKAKRVSRPWKERRFSVADAKKAKLWTKGGTWQDYPKRMLQMRARSFCLRDVFADLLKGIISAEEAMDYVAAKVVEAPPSGTEQLRDVLAGKSEEEKAEEFKEQLEAKATDAVADPPDAPTGSEPTSGETLFAAPDETPAASGSKGK